MRKYAINKTIKDQYYTIDKIVVKCINILKQKIQFNKYDILEPSAGMGAFSKKIPNIVAIDIEPKNKDIRQKDFLNTTYNCLFKKSHKLLCIIGNPPFGRNASLAIKFFNHAAKFSKTEYIAFIVPKSFKKNSVQNKLDLNFDLILSEDLPLNSFIKEGKIWDVPCCFQIWKRSIIKRIKHLTIMHSKYFNFIKNPIFADIAIRRVGGSTGRVFTENIKDFSLSTNYFIKLNKEIIIKDFVDIIKSIDFYEIVNNTAGVRSLSKPELIYKFEETLHKLHKENICQLTKIMEKQ